MRPEREDAGGETTRDAILGGRLLLRQPARGHRVGTDALLLAAAAPAEPGDRIVDVGAATGAVGLALALRVADARVVLFERDPAHAALAGRNAVENGLGDRVFVLCGDLLAGAGLAPATTDLVVTNPPFFEPGEAPLSPDPARAAAHALSGGSLAAWIDACADLLVRRGRLALIQRADKLAACLVALTPRFGAIRVTPILPRADADATRIVVCAVKDARTPLAVTAPLVLHSPDGRFTERAERVHREGVWDRAWR